jgi:hypothetical protein
LPFAFLHARDLRDVIGVAHVDGKYSLSQDGRDFLGEGAHRIRHELGSRVIKLWLAGDPAAYYPFRSPLWQPRLLTDASNVAAHPYYRGVFSMPFTTYILTVDLPNGVWFQNGMSPQEELAEERTFYELTRHLMMTYAGTGKTFVLQNWEGDWLLRLDSEGHLLPENRDPQPVAVAGMIRWLNARQRGVERARAELADQVDGVEVKHAVEVNLLRRAKGEPARVTVADDVLPFARADLYSYSAWESVGDRSGNLLQEMLAFLDSQTEGEGNIYVGEYGVPENIFGPADHMTRVVALTEAALQWGARYVVYWQIYCNEFALDAPHSGSPLNIDMRGFWLIRPDGTYSPVWSYFRSRLTDRTVAERRLRLLQPRELP